MLFRPLETGREVMPAPQETVPGLGTQQRGKMQCLRETLRAGVVDGMGRRGG